MKNLTLIITFTILTAINALLYSCGNPAQAENSYRYEYMFGHWCITNDVSIWCSSEN